MSREQERSKCPHCRAIGVRILDRPVWDGVVIFADYCGACGKNYPLPTVDERGSNILPMRRRQDEPEPVK